MLDCLCTCAKKQKKDYKIEGEVSLGYQPVKQCFEQLFRDGFDTFSQLCIYVGDQKVVDIWGRKDDNREIGEDANGDSLNIIWSSSKSVASILLAKMVDEGHLDFDEPVCKYWPEFAKNGKENVKVSDVMRHEAGLNVYETSIKKEWTLTENIKQNAMGKMIEDDHCDYKQRVLDPTQQHERLYHQMRDYISNEIFRRVEPQNRTMGEYFKDELQQNFDIHIGITDPEIKKRCIPCKKISLARQFKDMTKPYDERFATLSVGQAISLRSIMGQKATRYNATCKSRGKYIDSPIFEGMGSQDYLAWCNDETIRQGESPPAFMQSNARGLAKLGAAIVNDGSIGGIQVLGKDGLEALHAEPRTLQSSGMHYRTSFTKGGVSKYGFNQISECPVKWEMAECAQVWENALHENREGFYGWMGLGGSAFQWHRDLKISFAYVPSDLFALDFSCRRASRMQKIVVQCVQKMKNFEMKK